MLKNIFLTSFLLLTYAQVNAFCGFYVAKADADLFNESSQVIMVRDGKHTVITMANDFKGDVKDFAMVVPVPEVLSRKDIRVVRAGLFQKFDAYTAPRMVEYYDPEPNCPRDDVARLAEMTKTMSAVSLNFVAVRAPRRKKLKVKVKAKYKVDEYDIVILSAKQSDDLEKWLKNHGYKMPENAREALEPYVKSGMNFFVVKVNLERQQQSGYTQLRPLQIQFNSSNFMLPIRLGMANAKSVQDMIVYAFTKTGRVETTNYRTLKVHTDREIPHIFKTSGQFGAFYKAVFEKQWKAEGKNGVFLEYSWDLSATNPVKCDPCNTPLVTYPELAEAGVWWLKEGRTPSNYVGDLHVTRLHVRYSRDKFPQDLKFMITPNKERFQGRYVVRIPARGPFNCPRAETYLQNLQKRFKREVAELAALTDWNPQDYESYVLSVPRMTAPPRPRQRPTVIIREPVVEEVEELPLPLPDPEPRPRIRPIEEKPQPAPKPEEAPLPPANTEEKEEETALLPEEQLVEQPSTVEQAAPESSRLPLSGILLALSGLILGASLWIRGRSPRNSSPSNTKT